MAREFDALALKGHNYPIWVMDIKIAFASRGLVRQTQARWIYPRLEWRRWQMKKKSELKFGIPWIGPTTSAAIKVLVIF